MRNTGPATFGARVATHQPTQEESGWFFNSPPPAAVGTESEEIIPDDTAGKIQIGPLDT